MKGSIIRYIASFMLCLGPTVAAAEKPIKIGVLATFSGDFARYGALVRSGVEAGAAPGVEFIYEDEGCLPAQSVSAFNKLVNIDHVKLIIGPVCGSSQQAISPLLISRDVTAIFPTSAARKLFRESRARAFSAQFSIEKESAFNAEAMYSRGSRRTVIVATSSDFAAAHEAAFRAAYKGTVIESLLFPKIDKETIRAAALKIRTLNPDSLYVPDATPFFYGLRTQLNQTGLSAIRVFSVYSAQSSDLLAAEGSAADGLMYSYPDIGEQNALDYFPRVASKLMTEAAVACKGDPSCVRDTIGKNRLDEDGTLEGNIVLRVVRNGRFETAPLPNG